MTGRAGVAKDELIEQVAALGRERLPAEQAHVVEPFVREYYRGAAPEDIVQRSALDLYSSALSHYNFLRRRTPGHLKLRVYNPDFEEHGWQSTHTVVELATDDMPFVVDSVMMELNRHGFTVHAIVHPVYHVLRDEEGNLREVLPGDAGEATGLVEAVIRAEIDRRTNATILDALQADLTRVLRDVSLAVEDWPAMVASVRALAEDAERHPPPLDAEELREGVEFLRWLAADHFTFLGVRDHDLVAEDGEERLAVVAGSGLGILREKENVISESFAALPPATRKLARLPQFLVITQGNSRATVHRPAHLDYVGVRRFDAQGNVVGERRILGLYTSSAYHADPRQIPLVRRKIDCVIARAALPPRGHAFKALMAILESYPREELFQIAPEELYENALGILQLEERARTRLFVRRDAFGRFFSCLVFVPREKYNTELRLAIQRILMEAFNGMTSEFTVRLSESVLARIYIMVWTAPGSTPEYDLRDIEARLVQASRRWTDDLGQALVEQYGEERGNALFLRYGAAFPAGYRERYAVQAAVHDIEHMESLRGEADVAMALYLPVEAPPGVLQFKLFRPGQPAVLSDSQPMLEHMGVRVVDEHPYEIRPEGGVPVWVHDFGLRHEEGAEFRLEPVRELFQETFARVWRGEAENDEFNRLSLRARLAWREVALLRAYCRYVRQTNFTFSQQYIEQALAANAPIARLLAELFLARFDPSAEEGRAERVAELTRRIEAACDGVANLDDDRILRRFLALIQATLRTNYFQRTPQGAPKAYLSFKFDSARLPGLPDPRPLYEIFVYSPRVEAVHLRGGKVARGGIRWSDRMEDFRTEVLGLMKAQMVKNTIIVPVGAKGGFVVKQPPPAGDREALMHEVVECYRNFMRGLLDLTDNLVGGAVSPPADVVRYDGDDTYLVVAADKGTASFSDVANAISAEYGFWLGDAFASGGSAGYDHKKMGITARGVWESVKRHFRELGHDTQTTDFSVVGVGDMSGDVFGNGMLQSRHIKLVAAFDHRHIFVDPDPDPEASYRERERLFALPRSSWADYDPALISSGGGVYPRSAKSIPLSEPVRRVLGIEAEALTPAELASAALRAPVDLLYNGGIGTFVKSARESNLDVGDRANDAVRVNGGELRCRVVGEGGNLGFTQRGRIEYASRGGLIYTDAIDNSAGVDTSDHEVNIKILLNAVVAAGDMTLKQRNELLAELQEEVARHVLRDNYEQTGALSACHVKGLALLDQEARLIRSLEQCGRLNRALEFLPSDEELAERKLAGRGLTAPELAVLLAYAKIDAFQGVLGSDLPEAPYFARELESYFPTPLRGRFEAAMQAHPLRREIIATRIANNMVNRMGAPFMHRVQEESGASVAEVARAYALARDVFDMHRLWRDIEALDNQVPAGLQILAHNEAARLIQRASLWFLRNRRQLRDVAAGLEHFAGKVEALTGKLEQLLEGEDRAALTGAAAQLASEGLPPDLATRVARLDVLYSALDVVEAANATGRPVEHVAAVYFKLGARLMLPWLRERISALKVDSHWQGLARAALREDSYTQQRSITAVALKLNPELSDPQALLDAWAQHDAPALQRYLSVLSDLRAASAFDLAMLSVALRELRSLT